MGGRIRYTEEFKLGAVAQVMDKGHSVTSVAGRRTRLRRASSILNGTDKNSPVSTSLGPGFFCGELHI